MYDYFRYTEDGPQYSVPYIQFIPVPVFMPRQPAPRPGGTHGPVGGTHGGISGGGMPPGPPPSHTPEKRPPRPGGGGPGGHGGPGPGHGGSGQQPKFVESSSLRPCRFKFVYIWPRRGAGFWAWLINVGRRSISGYRWSRGRWAYFGMDLREIDSFICY